MGMLKVHKYSPISKPVAFVEVTKQPMPVGLPSSPACRANTNTWLALCRPVVHIFSPVIDQPETPSRVVRSARVSIQVASDPCAASVRPKHQPRSPCSSGSIHRDCCSTVPKSRSIIGVIKLPTIEVSFWRSLCSPRPLLARYSRMRAIARLLPFCPPNSSGSA